MSATTTTTRFSKVALVAYLEKRIAGYESIHGFTSETGTSQAEGKPARTQRAYGEYDALQTILEDLNDGLITE